MYRLTKVQRKNMERIEAWQQGRPFRESSRDKQPQVPQLSLEQVLADWLPDWNPQETGQFFTPLEMGRALVRELPLGHSTEPVRILEPCAGIGHLLYHLAGLPQAELTAYELSLDCARMGERLFPAVQWHQDNPFTNLSALEGQFDYVVMNPPFNIKWATAEAAAVCVSGAAKSEHLFMELAARALKPGGVAAVIAPYNLLDKMPQAMRAWFDQRMELRDSFGPLPGEFALTKIRVHGFIFERLPEPEQPKPPALPAGKGLQAVVDRAALSQSLKDVLPVVNRAAGVETLRNVHLAVEGHRLALRTSNLNTGIKTWAPVVQAGPAAELCAPAHLLKELVDLLPAAHLTLGATGERGEALGVSCTYHPKTGGRFDNRSRLIGCAVDDFPVSRPPAGQGVTVPAEALLGVIRQVRHFADREDSTPVLGGLLFKVAAGRLTVVATNRKCLALTVEALNLPDMEVVIELEVLDILSRHLRGADSVQVVLDEQRVLFRLPNLEFEGRLLGGQYPDYERVIPTQSSTQAVAGLPGLLAGVEGALRFGRDGSGRVTLAISGNGNGSGQISVGVDEKELGRYAAGVAAVVSGQPVRLAFVSEQLVQGLRALKADEVTVQVATEQPTAPVLFLAGSSKQLIMPLVK